MFLFKLFLQIIVASFTFKYFTFTDLTTVLQLRYRQTMAALSVRERLLAEKKAKGRVD